MGWQQKTKIIRESLNENSADGLIVTALDNVACKYLMNFEWFEFLKLKRLNFLSNNHYMNVPFTSS